MSNEKINARKSMWRLYRPSFLAQKIAPEKLWQRYALAIGLLLICLSSAHIISISNFSGSDELAHAVNISGRQRTLSQRILLFALKLQVNNNAVEDKTALKREIDLFEKSHKALLTGKDIGLSGKLSPALQEIYFSSSDQHPSLDTLARQYIDAARIVAYENSSSKSAALNFLQDIGPDLLLDKLNEAVDGFEQQSNDIIARNKLIASLTFAMGILLIFLEAIFIFLPAHLSIKRYLRKIDETIKQLRSSREEAISAQNEATLARVAAEENAQAKSLFLATMSHELRTPLNAIIGFSDLALTRDDNSIDEELLEFITLINQSGKHLLNLVSDLLDINSLSLPGQDLVEVSLPDMMQTIKTQFKDQASAKDIKFDVASNEAYIFWGDYKRIKRSIANLVSNAIKYTESGNVKVSSTITKNLLEIRVADTGIGIKDEDLNRIFEMFIRVKGEVYTHSQDGVGIGLYLTKVIIEALKGTISVESDLGKGSVFTVAIPVILSDPEHENNASL